MMIALETINFDTNKETKYIKNKIRNPPPCTIWWQTLSNAPGRVRNLAGKRNIVL